MKHLISALQFITLLPVGGAVPFRPGKMLPFFPVVGLIIGALLSGVDWLATHLWSVPVASLVDVFFLVLITGAFHLDGLGDTADGMFSHRGREKALLIMKDSRVGAMGLIAVFFGLAVKWAGISGISSPDRGLLLILVPAYARAGMLFGMRFLPYGRPEGGTGKSFFDEPLPTKGFWAVGIPMILTAFLGWSGIVLIVSFVLVTWMILLFYKKQMGCITGDMLGAMTESTESVLFLVISMGVLQ